MRDWAESITIVFGILNQRGSKSVVLTMALDISIGDFVRFDVLPGVHDNVLPGVRDYRKLHIPVSINNRRVIAVALCRFFSLAACSCFDVTGSATD